MLYLCNVRKIRKMSAFFLVAVIFAIGNSCRQDDGHEACRSAYYWSTVFELDSQQRAFIQKQGIRKIYLRYFDVVMRDGEAMPNATVQVSATVPKGVEIVPVVFIVNDCMRMAQPQLDSLLLTRILKMTETHDLGPVKEIQIDCDWTKQTQTAYFNMLERLHRRAAEKGIALSVTIRLHQLSMTVPPVDKGVLMMYNTGDITKRGGTNAILDMKDVEPFLPALDDYDLPLATAYPVFAWKVAFRGQHFLGFMHADDELPLTTGDTVLTVAPSPETVLKARDAVEKVRPRANDEMILYEISSQNLKRINTYHYEKVYDCRAVHAQHDSH